MQSLTEHVDYIVGKYDLEFQGLVETLKCLE